MLRVPRGILGAGWLLAIVAGLAAPLLAASPAPGEKKPLWDVNPVLLNAPGYVPPDDPESLSVVIGRRANAPAVKAPLHGGAPSMEALGRAILWALHHADRDSLRRLCVDEGEFARILWREFPQSRPATGLRWEDAYYLLFQRNLGGISRAIGEHGGRPLQFVRWDRADTVARYRNFRMHNGLALVVRDENGAEERLDLVRAAVERKGRYKLYALRD